MRSSLFKSSTFETFLFSYLLPIAFLALLSLSAVAGDISPQLKFKHLTSAQGLSHDSVFSMAQDSQGFLWIATEDGLNKYDGNSVVHYRHNASNPNSIPDNFIRKVFVDDSNTLWVGTANGLARYNHQKDSFEVFQTTPNSAQSLRDNTIWDIYQTHFDKPELIVSTSNGLHKYDNKENVFVPIRIRNYEEQIVEVKKLFQDSEGNLWVGTYDNGIFVLDDSLGDPMSLRSTNKWNLQIDANALFDMKIIDDNYWLATDNGVFVVSDQHEITAHYTVEHQLLSNQIRAIHLIDKSTVILGTNLGINTLDLHHREIDSIVHTDVINSLSDNWIMDIFKDQTNSYWISTYGGGTNKFNPISSKFTHTFGGSDFEVTAIGQNSDQDILIATNHNGYSTLYRQQDHQSPIAISKEFQGYISQIFSINLSEIWVHTTSSQLFKVDLTSGLFDEITQWTELANADPTKQVQEVNGNIWFISTDGQLSLYDIQTKSIDRISSDTEHIFETFVYHEKKFWLVTADGNILTYDVEFETFTKVDLPVSNQFDLGQARSIAVYQNNLWLGSYSQGVVRINLDSERIQVFNEQSGLSNNFIASIYLDDKGIAWFTTNKTISSINPIQNSIRNYGDDFGIINTEFYPFSSIEATDKHYYFGGSNGLYSFIPEDVLELKQNFKTPQLSKLLIANKPVAIKTNERSNTASTYTINAHINEISTLKLSHAQFPFSIEFTSPNARVPQQIRYQYKLTGLETNWIQADNSNLRATYTNLSPGDYVFEVQAFDIHSPSDVKSRSLKVTILPPWWLSSSAIFVYSLVVLLVVAYFLQQLRHKRLYHLQIKMSEERLKLSLWGSGDEMWDWNIKTGRIYRSNIWGILEFPQDGKRNVGTDQTNIHQQDIPRVREALNQHFNDETEHFESTYRVKDKNEQWIWVLDRGKIVERDDKNAPTRMTGTLKDISQIKKAEENLKLFAKCIQNISDAVVIYDRQFNVVDTNKAFQRITGKSKSSMLGTPLKFTNYPEHFTVGVKKHLITKGSWHGEIESLRDNNEVYLTDLNIDIIRDENNHISHFVGVFSDITKRKETEAELRRLASSDTLTGLPNRSYFQANQSRLVNNKIPHALLVFDLDNFKKINDSMGHEVGDVLLCKVAQRILSVGRKQDTVYRLGGDEFSLLIENTNDIHTITSIAKNILKTIAQPFKLKNQEVVLFSSIGIVLYPEDGVSPQELLKNADTAMYHAKDLGGNRYQFFNDSMNKQAVKRLQIENLIRHGLKDDYFSVFFQPKIEISTGKVAGMEALVRFETPTKGIISPVVFIPVSEETGQIIDIGEIVLRKSCFATKKWVDAGLFDGRIAVNLSAVQFTQPNLVGMIADVLKESGLPPKHLELEITEGTVMDSPQQAIDTMLQIRAMGIHLSLDDFGTGYSSLAYLKKFPLNTLKIDKAFVDDIEQSEQGRNMVATIVTIAHNLDLQVVAEGVETNQQLSFLAGLRCEQLQGYLYSKPLPESDFQKYLLSHQITDRSTAFSKS